MVVLPVNLGYYRRRRKIDRPGEGETHGQARKSDYYNYSTANIESTEHRHLPANESISTK